MANKILLILIICIGLILYTDPSIINQLTSNLNIPSITIPSISTSPVPTPSTYIPQISQITDTQTTQNTTGTVKASNNPLPVNFEENKVYICTDKTRGINEPQRYVFQNKVLRPVFGDFLSILNSWFSSWTSTEIECKNTALGTPLSYKFEENKIYKCSNETNDKYYLYQNNLLKPINSDETAKSWILNWKEKDSFQSVPCNGAVQGSDAIYKFEENKPYKCKDYTSGNVLDTVYLYKDKTLSGLVSPQVADAWVPGWNIPGHSNNYKVADCRGTIMGTNISSNTPANTIKERLIQICPKNPNAGDKISIGNNVSYDDYLFSACTDANTCNLSLDKLDPISSAIINKSENCGSLTLGTDYVWNDILKKWKKSTIKILRDLGIDNGSKVNIKSVYNNKFLSRCAGCSRNNISGITNNIFAHDTNGSNAWAQWEIQILSNGNIAFIGDNKKYLDVCSSCITGSTQTYAITVEGVDSSNTKSQWQLEDLGNGKLGLKSVHSNLFAAVCDGCAPNSSQLSAIFSQSSNPYNEPWSQWIFYKI